MAGNISKRFIFFTILCSLFVVSFFSANSMAAEPSNLQQTKDTKEVKEVKTINPDMKTKEENKPKAIQPGLGSGMAKNPYEKAEIIIKIFPAAENTFGYDILVDGRPFIHQPHVPSLQGNSGFATKEKALKTAQFMVKKIRNNNVPPSVTTEDLKKMGVIK